MLRGLTIATAALAFATGAGTGTATPRTASEACAPRAVAGLISAFFDAFNRGDARAAVEIMDPQAGPRNLRPRGWFSLDETDSRGPGRHHTFHRRAALARYFASRHRHAERLRLLTVQVGTGRGRADIEFRVRRTADDLRATGLGSQRVAFGKGALFCKRRKIFVWSMVHPDEHVSGPTCPGGAQACRRR